MNRIVLPLYCCLRYWYLDTYILHYELFPVSESTGVCSKCEWKGITQTFEYEKSRPEQTRTLDARQPRETVHKTWSLESEDIYIRPERGVLTQFGVAYVYSKNSINSWYNLQPKCTIHRITDSQSTINQVARQVIAYKSHSHTMRSPNRVVTVTTTIDSTRMQVVDRTVDSVFVLYCWSEQSLAQCNT